MEIKPQGEFKEPTVGIKGIHTFFPDGSNQPHKGEVWWGFPMSHFNTPVADRLAKHAESLVKRAEQIRGWTTGLSATSG